MTTADPTPTLYNSGDTNPETPMPALSLSPFAARLTDARLAIPVGQDMLADVIGVTKAAVCNYERGHGSPALLYAARAARALGMPDRVRDFHTLGRKFRLRPDLRDVNPGTHGYYDRAKLPVKRVEDADAARRALEAFAGLCEPLLDAKKLTLRMLAGAANIRLALVTGMFRTYQPRVGLTACANVAEVLGLDTPLEVFAEDDDLKPLTPMA